MRCPTVGNQCLYEGLKITGVAVTCAGETAAIRVLLLGTTTRITFAVTSMTRRGWPADSRNSRFLRTASAPISWINSELGNSRHRVGSPGRRRSSIQPTPAADHGEYLLELGSRQPGVDQQAVTSVRRVESCSGCNATISSAENKSALAAVQVQRSTHREATFAPQNGGCATNWRDAASPLVLMSMAKAFRPPGATDHKSQASMRGRCRR